MAYNGSGGGSEKGCGGSVGGYCCLSVFLYLEHSFSSIFIHSAKDIFFSSSDDMDTVRLRLSAIGT